jgi:hypothetical protein
MRVMNTRFEVCRSAYTEPQKSPKDTPLGRLPGEGEGEWIALRYPRPVKVSAIGIIPGHDKIDSECGIDRFFHCMWYTKSLSSSPTEQLC